MTVTKAHRIGSFYAFILQRNEQVRLTVVARSNYEAVKEDVCISDNTRLPDTNSTSVFRAYSSTVQITANIAFALTQVYIIP